MKLTLVARDPESVPDNSPTLFRNEDGDWIIQGFVVDDPATLSQMHIPHRMIQFFIQE
jgi:hypothetical protein